MDLEFVDLHLPEQNGPVRFTFLWLDDKRWEGKVYTVDLGAPNAMTARLSSANVAGS